MINQNTVKRIYTSLLLFFLVFLMASINFILIYILILISIFCILEFLKISQKIFANHLYKFFFNTIFFLYIFIYCYFFVFFSNFLPLKIMLYSLLLGCVASDIGGFIVGKMFKGKKLTKISPNKTYSGAIGSIFFTCLTISLLFFIFTDKFNINILLISIITSIGCQLGDLFISYLKRCAKIKDTGSLLPGHGGILDRIDGILVGIPAGFIAITIIY